MFRKTTAVALCVTVAVAGCATSSANISAQSVSPLIYQSHDCDQLSAELARINVRTLELGGRLDQAASNDAALMAVGLVLFWPSLFFLGGTRAQEAEFARLAAEILRSPEQRSKLSLLAEADAHLSARVDRLSDRVERVERRLDLAEPV
jgi:hypothetical protein